MQYFIAAKTPNWQDRFTPSFRVWFAIMAIGTALKFFWAGENSAMLRTYTDMVNQIIAASTEPLAAKGKMMDLSDFNPAESAQYILKYSQLFLPFTYLFFLIILAAVYRAWGETLGFVVRLRFVFAIIVPGSLLGFVLAVLTSSVSAEAFVMVNNISLLIMFLSYFFVAYFGAYGNVKDGGRFGRSLFLTALIIITVMLATIAALVPTTILMVKNTFPNVIPLVEATATMPKP